MIVSSDPIHIVTTALAKRFLVWKGNYFSAIWPLCNTDLGLLYSYKISVLISSVQSELVSSVLICEHGQAFQREKTL